MAAYVLQHEIDHLDGMLLSDVSLEVDEEFDNASDDEKNDIINMYLDSLDLQKKNIDEAIESDPESKKLSDGIKFMEGVARGEIEIT